MGEPGRIEKIVAAVKGKLKPKPTQERPPWDPRIKIIGEVTDAASAEKAAKKATEALSKQKGSQ